ncbi:DUF3630 family protein [Pseudoalteromonas luteoviolacea]|uniref:DUF3630 domain-containing protein n=1 Tax=Pseudoalteromonas luteoviolacea NCIMB 1942 TaxID=1365253 RepID=A0A166Y2M1_9GAMM|nr:DUF3630 family protein [Pseudoalteromonas luteoviolacea]KZN41382.1 hypothetical protein N482_03520 [Pseudoalteromonas luteoviolacea NCIMB 1942]KZW98480.1 hypothetical protein JL49_23060 [Pseudoalteromonas luteoviolacea]
MTKITYLEEQDVLLIRPSILPDSDDFQLWGEVFLTMDKLKIIEFNQGADRHQWRFEFDQQPFAMNYEYYSESIWISPEGIDASTLMSFLHTTLCLNLQQ